MKNLKQVLQKPKFITYLNLLSSFITFNEAKITDKGIEGSVYNFLSQYVEVIKLNTVNVLWEDLTTKKRYRHMLPGWAIDLRTRLIYLPVMDITKVNKDEILAALKNK